MEKNKNETKKIKLIVLTLLLLIIIGAISFCIWFFNRKFEITFDLNNGTKSDVVLVKYNKTIDDEDIKGKDKLGEKFIGWFLVVGQKDGKDVLADKPFDFSTEIKENIKLKAVYEGIVEKITIKFDTKGGSKISPITINKGEELILPKNPTLKGNIFKGWVDKNETPIYNKALLAEDTTLYAKWEKVKVEKKEEPKIEEPKIEEPKKEEPTIEVKPEKITLSLSRDTIHYKME